MAKQMWIAGAGLPGCLFDTQEVFTNKRDAINFLMEVFPPLWGSGQRNGLTKHGRADWYESADRRDDSYSLPWALEVYQIDAEEAAEAGEF